MVIGKLVIGNLKCVILLENVLEMDSELVLKILNIIENKMSDVQTDKYFNYVN